MPDVDPKDLAKKIDTGMRNHDLSQAIQTIEREQNSDAWKKTGLAATNAELDKISKEFGTLDLVGTENGSLVVENTKNHTRIKIAADTNRLTINTPDGKVVDVQKFGDGSQIQKENLSDGKVHVTKVQRPGGTHTEYLYTDKGVPRAVIEFDENNKKTAELISTDNATWHKKMGPAEMPAQMFGNLAVDANGVHTFKDKQWGTTFIRRPDGSVNVLDPQGKDIPQLAKPKERAKG